VDEDGKAHLLDLEPLGLSRIGEQQKADVGGESGPGSQAPTRATPHEETE
jgi:hypothetical protein